MVRVLLEDVSRVKRGGMFDVQILAIGSFWCQDPGYSHDSRWLSCSEVGDRLCLKANRSKNRCQRLEGHLHRTEALRGKTGIAEAERKANAKVFAE